MLQVGDRVIGKTSKSVGHVEDICSTSGFACVVWETGGCAKKSQWIGLSCLLPYPACQKCAGDNDNLPGHYCSSCNRQEKWAKLCRLPDVLDRLDSELPVRANCLLRRKLLRFRDVVRGIVDAAWSGRAADKKLLMLTDLYGRAVVACGFELVARANGQLEDHLYMEILDGLETLEFGLSTCLCLTARKPLPKPPAKSEAPLVVVDNSFWQDNDIDWCEGLRPSVGTRLGA